jgi:AraC-like DNA-binding protein/mannose-6-phosphate isomerase-like protein (cupin superfamily)
MTCDYESIIVSGQWTQGLFIWTFLCNVDIVQSNHSQIMTKAEGFENQRLIILPDNVIKRWLDSQPLVQMLPSDIGYFPNAEKHLKHRPIGCDQWIVIYCVRGSGWVRFDDQTFTVQPSQTFFIPPGQTHAYGASEHEPWTIYWLHIAFSQPLPSLYSMAWPHRPILQPGHIPSVVGLFEELLQTLEQGYSEANLISASTCLVHLLGQLMVHAIYRSGNSPSLQQRLDMVLEHMQRQIHENLRLEDLAAICHLSLSHFSAVFRQRTGYAVMDYFTRLKIQHACHLLDTTDQPVKTIARTLGYEDPLYFSRVFHRIYGESPSAYRSKSKG